MDEANRSGMSTVDLLGATWRTWRSHAGMFVLLMGIPIATLLLMALIMNYVIAPHPEGTPLRRSGWGWALCRKSPCSYSSWGVLRCNTGRWPRQSLPRRKSGADEV